MDSAVMATQAILVVEDNPADAYLIRQAVEECGNNLYLWTLPDGPEALTFLRKDYPLTHVPTPALIILDLRLAKMDGTELLPKIRHLPAHHATPIVILSSAPKEQEEQHCLQLGATAYVQKSQNFYAYFADIKGIVQQWLTSASAQAKRGL
jgi:chemotaxis family two-component system response regulator Rcp1